MNRELSEAYVAASKTGTPRSSSSRTNSSGLMGLAKEELQSATSDVVRESDPHYRRSRTESESCGRISSARAPTWPRRTAAWAGPTGSAGCPRRRQMSDLDHRQTSTKELHGELFAKMSRPRFQQNLEKVSADRATTSAAPLLSKARRSVAFATRAGLGLAAGLFLCALVIILGEIAS